MIPRLVIALLLTGSAQATELPVPSNVEVYRHHRDCEQKREPEPFNTLPSGIMDDYFGYLLQDDLGDVPEVYVRDVKEPDIDCGGVGGGDDIGSNT